MKERVVKVGSGGRIVLPAEVRSAMGVRAGDTLILAVDQEGVRLLSSGQAIQRAQDRVARFVTEGRSLADELLSERR